MPRWNCTMTDNDTATDRIVAGLGRVHAPLISPGLSDMLSLLGDPGSPCGWCEFN